jgi:hypothetical protein
VQRRRVLAALGTAVGLAGCSAVRGGSDDEEGAVSRPTNEPTTRTGGTVSGGTATGGLAAQGIPPTICSEPIQADPGIYAIGDPAVASDWTGRDVDAAYRRDGRLTDDATVIGIEADGRARAYPLSVLTIHEVVNDEFGGPVLVTYCPLCRSGLVAARVVDGEPTTFAVSGLLWQPERIQSADSVADGRAFGASRSEAGDAEVSNNGNLVMYDRATRSYWSQVLGKAICGPATGTALAIRPSTVATWGAWRRAHPGTDVLLPPPYSGTVRPTGDEAGATPTEN